MKTSAQLQAGELYSRNDLKQQFEISDATLNNGIFHPKGHESIWLFVTENKSADRTQYEDHLDGDNLYFDGQTQGRTDHLVEDHQQSGLELLLFHRESKDEYPGYAFRYEGPFEYVSSEGLGPTKFHLRRAGGMPLNELAVVKSPNAIRQNIRRFYHDLTDNLDRARSLTTQTTYWVCEGDRFGPAKFVGFERMNFARYNAAVEGNSTGAHFDGGVTRRAIENVTEAFAESAEMGDRLRAWIATTFGPEALANVTTEKWRFVDLDLHRKYWTFVCNPDKYDGLAAVTSLDEMSWILDRGDPQPGDRIALWQAKGKTGRRGVIALGEVIAPPVIEEERPEEREHWVSSRPEEQSRTSRFRVIRTPGLPLWEDEHPELFSDLSAARARGGTVFKLQSEKWHTLAMLGAVDDNEPPSTPKVRATGQGYGLDTKARRAVERHAQGLAERHFIGQGYEVTDVSGNHSYDLLCTRGAEELRVEVKGTTGDGRKVILTRNEVRHAQEHAGRVALFVVSEISLDRTGSEPVASGGEVVLFQPWEIDESALSPTQYEYQLPPGPTAS